MKSGNIRDKFIISIVDNNGIKQFSIHRLVKRFIFYFVIFFVISTIIVFFTIKFLANELKEMKAEKNLILDKYIHIYDKNENIKQQVEISQYKLDEINRRIFELEDIISMKDSVVNNDNVAEYDISSLSESKKHTILQLLPNSLPFYSDDFSTSSLKSGLIFDIPKETPIYATADGIVDLTRDNYTNLCINKKNKECAYFYHTRSNSIKEKDIDNATTHIIWKNKVKDKSIIELESYGKNYVIN